MPELDVVTLVSFLIKLTSVCFTISALRVVFLPYSIC